MAINSTNSNSFPASQNGSYGASATVKTPGSGTYTPATTGTSISRKAMTQIVGLVPVFPCTNTDCREGKYTADSIADDTQFPLPVFAQNPVGSPVDLYYNDYNTFLFDNPVTALVFFLQKLVNGVWTTQTALNNNLYGIFYNTHTLCANNNWIGFTIQWWKVLAAFGEGTYRFQATQDALNTTTCFQTPSFCLKEFDCYLADRTTKFEVTYSGGRIGNIDKTNCGGQYWDFCCPVSKTNGTSPTTKPIAWSDSIRIGGFFGYEKKAYEHTRLKYQTGLINPIRDEALRKFQWKSLNQPFWFHDRFSVYGLMADKILASDYNINNSDYNIKRYCVMLDGGYEPTYKGESRYTRLTVDFKSQTEYLLRNRCC